MDPFSIAIIVTCLSVGCVLVYLFKFDFDRRQQQQSLNSNKLMQSKKVNNKVAKVHQQHNSSLKSPIVKKQVPLVEIALTETNTQLDTNSNVIAKHTSNKPQQQLSSSQPVKVTTSSNNSTTKAQQAAKVVKKKENISLTNGTTKKENSIMVFEDDPEFAKDEVDSSILMGVFNPSAHCTKSQTKTTKKTGNLSEFKQSKKNIAQANNYNSSILTEHYPLNANNSTSYSSEQLFNIISSTRLSKDEVELAVEALLNKLESVESNWKQPKSDPIQRLKNQVRDLESALLMETHNHEQTKARISELKSQVQNEKSATASAKDELMKLRKELNLSNLTLEQARSDLSRQQLIQKQIKEETGKVINNLEQDKSQLQALLSNSSVKDDLELAKLRQEYDEKLDRLQTYKLSNQAMSEKIQELENKLHNTEIQFDNLRSNKQQENYEACAKINELEADRSALDKALKHHMSKLKEVSESNILLEESVGKLQLINENQEDMLKRLQDNRQMNEASMKRTLAEMEKELKELQTRLSANSINQDERLRKEMSHVERELSNADQREQKLVSEMKELREGLGALLPNYIKNVDLQLHGDDWVRQYINAVKQLAITVEELKSVSNNNNTDDSVMESPEIRKSADKSTLTLQTNGRVGSPVSNGRASKGK